MYVRVTLSVRHFVDSRTLMGWYHVQRNEVPWTAHQCLSSRGSVAGNRIYADVRCCNSDLMTSQEPQSAVIHGYSATSGEKVTVQMLTGKTWTTNAASDGTWSISLDPQPASTGATIKVRCVCLRIHIHIHVISRSFTLGQRWMASFFFASLSISRIKRSAVALHLKLML